MCELIMMVGAIFLKDTKNTVGPPGWSMRQKPHVSFKAYVLKIFFIEISKAI